jgi:hypothetical protein
MVVSGHVGLVVGRSLAVRAREMAEVEMEIKTRALKTTTMLMAMVFVPRVIVKIIA